MRDQAGPFLLFMSFSFFPPLRQNNRNTETMGQACGFYREHAVGLWSDTWRDDNSVIGEVKGSPGPIQIQPLTEKLTCYCVCGVTVTSCGQSG